MGVKSLNVKQLPKVNDFAPLSVRGVYLNFLKKSEKCVPDWFSFISLTLLSGKAFGRVGWWIKSSVLCLLPAHLTSCLQSPTCLSRAGWSTSFEAFGKKYTVCVQWQRCPVPCIWSISRPRENHASHSRQDLDLPCPSPLPQMSISCSELCFFPKGRAKSLEV